MKKSLLSALAVAGMALGSAQGAHNGKIAVANIVELTRQSSYAGEIENMARDKQAELEKAAAALNEKLAEEGKKINESMKEKGVTMANETSVARAQNSFNLYKKTKEAEFERMRLDANIEIEEAGQKCKTRIKELIKEYGNKNGMLAILDSNSESVLFAGADLDVTEELSSFLVDEFKKDKRKASLLASVTSKEPEGTILASADGKGHEKSKASAKVAKA